MQIAEIRTVAKSLPPLRWNTHKSLILSYSADFSVIFYKKHRTVNWILLSFALMSTYTLFIRINTFTTIKEIMIPSLVICGLSFIIMWCSCYLKKILRKRQHWKCSFEKVSSYGSLPARWKDILVPKRVCQGVLGCDLWHTLFLKLYKVHLPKKHADYSAPTSLPAHPAPHSCRIPDWGRHLFPWKSPGVLPASEDWEGS